MSRSLAATSENLMREWIHEHRKTSQPLNSLVVPRDTLQRTQFIPVPAR